MFEINAGKIKFTHIVIFTHEDTVFASAYQNDKNRIFLAFNNGQGRIYTRNGYEESWEVMGGQDSETIRSYIQEARAKGTPTFYLNGSCKLVTEGKSPTLS